MSELPSGTVTFLFTDIEGSTELLKRLGRDRFERVLAEHDGVLRAAVAASGGWVVDTQGDSLFAAFRSASEGVSAAIAAQRDLAAHEWPEQERVRVRMGLHSGEPKAGDERYVGIGVHRAARIGAAAHGGQVLVSETTRALLSDDLPADVSLRDLGRYRLKDIDEPVRLYQVVAAGLDDRFPSPRTLPRRRNGRVRLALMLAGGLAVAGVAVAAVLLSTGSASTKPVRLVANSIAVFDPKTAKAVGDVPLGFSPTDVDAGGDDIWVLNGLARTATAIDPSTLKVDETVGLDGDPDSQYAAGSTEWVGFRGAVDEVTSGPDGSGATKIPLWRPPSLRASAGQTCYVYVTGDGSTVWVAEGQNVAVIDADQGTVLHTQRLPADTGAAPGSTCYGLRYTDGHLIAIQNPGSSIGTVDLQSDSYTPVESDANLYAQEYESSNWAYGFGSDWIVSTIPALTNGVWNGGFVSYLERLDPTTGDITTKVRTAGSDALAVDPATGIWTGGSNNSLVEVDPASGQITRTVKGATRNVCCPSDEVGNAIAVGHGRLWVALDSP